MATDTQLRDSHTRNAPAERGEAITIRIGGIAGLLAGLLALSLNFILLGSETPDPNAPVSEIAAYVQGHTEALMASTTARFGVFFLLVIFGVGLYRLSRGSSEGHHRAWAVMGMAGVVWLVSVGTVSNSIELAGVWQAGSLDTRPEMLMTIWSLASVMFVANAIAWATFVLGFTMAGVVNESLPRLLGGYGIVVAALCLAGGIGVGSVVNEGWFQYPWFLSELLFVLWLFSTAGLMIKRSVPTTA
ncbi:MAG TPA: hypothetical protein VGC47_07275 [Acidimicrobiia bacterium]